VSAGRALLGIAVVSVGPERLSPSPRRTEFADVTVRVRADATFDQVSALMSELNLRPDSVLDGYRIDYEARTVSVYVLNNATPAQRQRLREMFLLSSIIVSIEP